MVDRDSPEAEQRFVISFPQNFKPHSPFARATRPMMVFDIETREIVFLKDYHGVDVDGMKKEGDIGSLLESNCVPNFTHFGKGDKFCSHITFTRTPKNKKRACLSRKLRISLDAFTRPLTAFKSSRELVSAIADAMEACQQAYVNARVRHSDISVDNILIADDGKGLLIDWDLSLNLNSDNKPSSKKRLGRTGTLRFMSAAIVVDDEKRYEPEDALESCLHVLTWVALRYTKYTTTGSTRDFLRGIRNAYDFPEDTDAGYVKKAILLCRLVPREVKFDHRPQLDALIGELTETFAVRYEKFPSAIDFQAILDAQTAKIPESIIAQLPAFSYLKRLGDVGTPSWLVDTFRRHLNAGPWPVSDNAARR